ncbi:hypothetical protein BCR39DRAFT_586986 [Naematelia encephala]|uniref:Uncharacterized protein n=1 Tax=Naematelia encephala TaxID=71784 RepID=A0A1Y2BBV1_9TREE|nr:hypothetical protein BCR39DRAFT_586986 [Naematelia encephala]
MCEPTPTSTLYSTSTSWLYTTVTTSYSSVITPPPQISTSWLTSCLSPLAQELFVTSGDSSASAITRSTSSGTYSSNHVFTSNADTGSVDATASAHAQKAARLVHFSNLGNSDLATATTVSIASESVSAGDATTTNSHSLHPRHALDQHQVTARSFGNPGLSKGDGKGCASYTTFASYATSIPKASTSWITSVYTSSSSSLITIPTSTLYATCESTSTSHPGTSTHVPSTSTPASTLTSISTSTLISTISTSTSTAALNTSSSVAISSLVTSPGDSELIVGHYHTTIPSSIPISPIISRSSGDNLVVSQTSMSSPIPQAQESSVQAEQFSEPIDTTSSTWTSQVLPTLPATISTDSLSSIQTAPSSRTQSNTPPITLPISQPRTGQLATNSGVGSKNRIPSTTLATSGSDHQPSKGTDKGKTAGAVIGGLIGVCLLIGLVLFGVRTYLKRKRQHRTHELRSSWFYGGDVLGPNDDGGEKTYTSRPGQVPRSSAPSHTSRASSRLSRVMPAFLGHARHASGRFPVFARQSVYGPPPPGPSISWPANSPDVPVPIQVRSISTPIPLEHDEVSPDLNHVDFAGSPQLPVAPHDADTNWGQSYARQDIHSQTQAPMILFTAPTESAYSSSPSGRSAELIDNDEPSSGQATTTVAAGRASPFDLPLFPLPPNTTPLSFPEPSISGTLPLRPYTRHEPTSSLFEYADYDHEYPYAESSSHAMQTHRQTKNDGYSDQSTWNDNNRRWDGTSMAFTTSIYSQPSEAGAGQSVYGGLNVNNPNSSRRSKSKSVRWDNEGSGNTQIHDLARAL